MNFDVKNMRRADQLMGGGAIALFIFMFFFKWYGGSATSSVGNFSVSSSLNGWHSFTNSRWIWLITIVVALVVVAIRMGMIELESPIPLGTVVAALGAVSTVLIFYRILDHPSGGFSGSAGSLHYGIKIGIWLGLIAAGVITWGGVAAMQDEGASLGELGTHTGGAAGSSSTGGAAGPAPGASAPGASPPSTAASAGGTATPPLPPPAAPPAGGHTPAAG